MAKKQQTPNGVEQPKCANCGAPLVYSVKKGALICGHCGNMVSINHYWEDHKISGFDFEDLENQVTQEEAEDIPVYNCESCGAEILTAKEEVSLTCPYCGNNIVLTEKISGKLRPNAVIPFRITPSELTDAVHKYYKDKVLLPKDFFSESQIGKITGIYVPFWSFTGEVSGGVDYRATNSSTRDSGTEEITTTDEYKLMRNARVSFKDLILDASEKMDDAYMDSILPYDLSDAKDFNMAYLAGYAADRFDVKSGKLASRAEERMRTSAYNAVKNMGSSREFPSATLVGGSLAAVMKDVKYLLLPVYVFDIKYKKKNYHYAVNGQTGKVAGEVPTDRSTCRRYQGIHALAAFAAVMAVSVLSYFMGV